MQHGAVMVPYVVRYDMVMVFTIGGVGGDGDDASGDGKLWWYLW